MPDCDYHTDADLAFFADAHQTRRENSDACHHRYADLAARFLSDAAIARAGKHDGIHGRRREYFVGVAAGFASGLRENEWYEIKLTYTARGNTAGEYRHYSKETRWTVQTARLSDLSADARAVKWNVTIVRVEGLDPFASLNRTPVSAPSATRSFIELN